MTSLHYVYGIVPAAAGTPVAAASLRGLDSSIVRTVAEGPLAAAVSEVDAAEYDEAVLNERVRDLDWLTPRAAAHQRVNVRLLEIAEAVLPLSFGALYRDQARVREMLREDVGGRQARLDAVTGRAEWVVTVTREADAVPGADEDLANLEREIEKSPPGRGYLLEKQRSRVASAATERADAEAARRALDVLRDASERVYREPVAKGGDVVVVRLSLLARRSETGALERVIAALGDELGAQGYHVRANGPWPAYRFGSLA